MDGVASENVRAAANCGYVNALHEPSLRTITATTTRIATTTATKTVTMAAGTTAKYNKSNNNNSRRIV